MYTGLYKKAQKNAAPAITNFGDFRQLGNSAPSKSERARS